MRAHLALLLMLSFGALAGACRSTHPNPDEASSAKGSKSSADADDDDDDDDEKPSKKKKASVGIDPKRVVAVIAGVLEWQDPNLGSFSDVDRKDLELAKRLRQRGTPKKAVHVLLDEEATTKAVSDTLSKAAESAHKDDVLVFYYAGHGVKNDDGSIYFASYDMQTSQQGSGIELAALADTIGEGFAGERVVLMADCCYSGGLADVAKTLRKKHGKDAIAVTSAEASNLSTANWTFTQTIIDAWLGDSLADRNHDGAIQFGELRLEVADAMKNREMQRSGFFADDDDAVFAPAEPGPKFGEGDKPFVQGAYARDAFGKVVRVRESGSKPLVRSFDYATYDDRKVPSEDLTAIEFQRYAKGSKQRVFWEGKLWDAEIVKTDGDFHFITYPGWPNYWDEWVLSDRIAGSAPADEQAALKLKKGDQAEVEWRGTWYPARVLAVEAGRALITYDGYDSSWDEWVGPARIRARGKAGE